MSLLTRNKPLDDGFNEWVSRLTDALEDASFIQVFNYVSEQYIICCLNMRGLTSLGTKPKSQRQWPGRVCTGVDVQPKILVTYFTANIAQGYQFIPGSWRYFDAGTPWRGCRPAMAKLANLMANLPRHTAIMHIRRAVIVEYGTDGVYALRCSLQQGASPK